MNRQYIWPYPKLTRSCRVELSIGNEHVFCSRRVYFSAGSNSTYKTFLCSSIKRKTQKITLNFKGTAIFAITIYMPCVFYTTGSHVCLWIDRRSHIWFLQDFLYLTRHVFYALKMTLLRINRWISKLSKYSFPNEHQSHFSELSGRARKTSSSAGEPRRSCDWISMWFF